MRWDWLVVIVLAAACANAAAVAKILAVVVFTVVAVVASIAIRVLCPPWTHGGLAFERELPPVYAMVWAAWIMLLIAVAMRRARIHVALGTCAVIGLCRSFTIKVHACWKGTLEPLDVAEIIVDAFVTYTAARTGFDPYRVFTWFAAL